MPICNISLSLICPLDMDGMTSQPWTAFYYILFFSLALSCWLLCFPVHAISVSQAVAGDGQLVQQAEYSSTFFHIIEIRLSLDSLDSLDMAPLLSPDSQAHCSFCEQSLSLKIVGEFSIILFGYFYYDALSNHLNIALGYCPILKLWSSQCHAHNS